MYLVDLDGDLFTIRCVLVQDAERVLISLYTAKIYISSTSLLQL